MGRAARGGRGPRALPALERFLAQPATPTSAPAALAPVFVRAGHPEAAALVRAELEKVVYDDAAGPPAAAAMLRDESFVTLLEEAGKNERPDDYSLFAVDRALRAIRGRGIDLGAPGPGD